MWILIDDIRTLDTVDYIARTADDAAHSLMNYEWKGAVFDHDLGEEKTGYDILTWALESGFCPPIVQLITSNPVGRDRMEAALLNAGYVKKGITYFFE